MLNSETHRKVCFFFASKGQNNNYLLGKFYE
nr:MAG TPA: hypothetical protein [Caudoviricetes sp.]